MTSYCVWQEGNGIHAEVLHQNAFMLCPSKEIGRECFWGFFVVGNDFQDQGLKVTVLSSKHTKNHRMADFASYLFVKVSGTALPLPVRSSDLPWQVSEVLP